jgi:hypothetical protein
MPDPVDVALDALWPWFDPDRAPAESAAWQVVHALQAAGALMPKEAATQTARLASYVHSADELADENDTLTALLQEVRGELVAHVKGALILVHPDGHCARCGLAWPCPEAVLLRKLEAAP